LTYLNNFIEDKPRKELSHKEDKVSKEQPEKSRVQRNSHREDKEESDKTAYHLDSPRHDQNDSSLSNIEDLKTKEYTPRKSKKKGRSET